MKSFKGFNFSFSTTACHQWKRHSLCLCLTENCLTEALDWDCRQWAETDIQEVPPEHEEEFLYCAGTDWPKRVWSLLHWDIKEPSRHNPVPCAPGWSCLSREVHSQMNHCGSFQPGPFCDSVKFIYLLLWRFPFFNTPWLRCSFL